MTSTHVDVPARPTAVPPAAAEVSPRRLPLMRRMLASPAAVAVLTWLIVTPVAVLAPRRIGFSPFDARGAFAPVTAGVSLLVVMCAVAWWRRADERVTGVAAGLFAAWLALALQVSLNGTPFGFGGVSGDIGRISAAATRYTVTAWSADGMVDGLPSEYPPLYPWLIGRAAVILDVPAWRLLAPAEILFMSFAVLAVFLLWQRLVPPAVALACAGVGLLAYGEPFKPYSIIALLILVPWVIATFANPPKGRLHWLPAGIIGGLLTLTYFGWMTFGAPGIIAIVIAGWRRAESRRRYVGHVLRVSAIMIMLLIGLAGLFWYRRSWWGRPTLYLVLGTYLFLADHGDPIRP